VENRLKISSFKTKAEVTQLFKNCRTKFINQQIKVFYSIKEIDFFYIVISVDRKFGNAVKRNLVKRRMKNALHIVYKSKSEKFKGIRLLIKIKGTYDSKIFSFSQIKENFELFFDTI
jgi:ribonuclease P protein component